MNDKGSGLEWGSPGVMIIKKPSQAAVAQEGMTIKREKPLPSRTKALQG